MTEKFYNYSELKDFGISTKHEEAKKRNFESALNEKKNLQLGEVRQEDPFQWKVRYYNFDHFIFHVT